MMGPYWGGSGGWWMAGAWLTMLLFWALVIVGIVALIKFVMTRGATSLVGGSEMPLEILRRRYAAGDLTKEQFEQMKRDIA